MPSSRHPHLKAWLKMLLLVAGLLTGIDVAIWRSGWFERRFPQVAASHPDRAISQVRLGETLKPRLMLIGNSRTKFAVRPTVLEQAVGMTGRPPATANLAIGGATPLIWYLATKTLLNGPAGPRLKGVVVGLTPNELLQPVETYTAADLYPLMTWPGDVMPADVGWEATVRMGLGLPWQLWRYRQITNQILGEKASLVLGDEAITDRREGNVRHWRTEDYAADMALGFSPGTGRARLSPPDPLSWPEGPPPQDHSLRRLLALCHSHGLSVYLALMPEHGRSQDHMLNERFVSYARSLPVDQIVNLRDVCQASTYWQDWMHVNPDGATVISRKLGQSLREPLRHALQ